MLSRQVIVAFVSIISGVLTMMGVTLPERFAEELASHIEIVIGGLMAIYGIVMWILRAITSSPLIGWFRKE